MGETVVTREEFENKWLNKIVKYKGESYPTLKDDVGQVTAALYHYNIDDESILAVRFRENGWISLYIEDKYFEQSINDFEILEEYNG